MESELSLNQVERMRALVQQEEDLTRREAEFENKKQMFEEFRDLLPQVEKQVNLLHAENAKLDQLEAEMKQQETVDGTSLLLHQMNDAQPLQQVNMTKLMSIIDHYAWPTPDGGLMKRRAVENEESCFLSMHVDGQLLTEIYTCKALLK